MNTTTEHGKFSTRQVESMCKDFMFAVGSFLYVNKQFPLSLKKLSMLDFLCKRHNLKMHLLSETRFNEKVTLELAEVRSRAFLKVLGAS